MGEKEKVDLVAGETPENPLKVEERVSMAGSRAEAARRAAFVYATSQFIATDAVISFPVPVIFPSGAGFAFMLYLSAPDVSEQDFALYEPEVVVTVDAKTLDPLGHYRWRDPVKPEEEDPFAYRLPPEARTLPPAQIDALEAELLHLCDRVASLFDRGDLLPDERDIVARFDRLFRFFVPDEMFPYYHQLNPAFFGWLASQAGAADRDQTKEVPRPKADIQPPPRLLPERYERFHQLLDLPTGDAWRLSPAMLAAALAHLGLKPELHSPLAGLSADKIPAENLVEWLKPEWRAALHTLCNPTWEIERLSGNVVYNTATRIYVGSSADEVVWVRHETDGEDHLIAFPESPESLKNNILELLGAPEIGETKADGYELTPAEFGVLVCLADQWALAGEASLNVTVADLEAAVRDEEKQGAGWLVLASCLSPSQVTVDLGQIKEGVSLLRERGLLTMDNNRVVVGPVLGDLIVSLGRPETFCSLWVHHYSEPENTLSGFTVVRTGDSLWLWEMAEDWDPALPKEDMTINLLQVTGTELASVLDDLLGTGASE